MSIPPPGPLAYEGQVVVPFIVRDFPPTTAFNQFSVPTIWIEPTAENAYILTGKPLGVANWLLFVNGGGNVGTLKGNTGGSVSPTVAGLINVVGDGTTITIAGNPGTNTLTASLVGGQEAIDSFQPDSGTNPVVPNAAGLVTMSGSGSITTVGSLNTLTTQLTGLTNHAVLVGAGTTTITKVGPSATTGAPLISGGAAADPGFSTTVVINDAAESLTLSAGANTIQPTIVCKNTWNTAGGGQASNIIATAHSSASQSDVGYFSSGQWDGPKYWNFGMTSTASAYANAFNINYATGTPAPEGGTVMMSIAQTGAITIPAGDLTVTRSSSGTNVFSAVSNTSNTASSDASYNVTTGGASARHAYMQYSILGGVNWSQGVIAGSDTFWIASRTGLGGDIRLSVTTGGAVTFNNAFTFPTADGTAGQVLTTNGAGTVTWSSSGVGTWTDTSGVFTASRNSAYFLTAASTATLPAAPVQGDTVDFVCDTTGSCVITGNTGQFIRIANQLSSAAGTATNSARGDTLSLVYRAATTTWFAFDAPNGGWTTA